MSFMARTSTRLRFICTAASLLLPVAASAGIININVTNGSFESVAVANTSNQLGYHTNGGTAIQNVTGWTNNSNGSLGYNFVFTGNSTPTAAASTAMRMVITERWACGATHTAPRTVLETVRTAATSLPWTARLTLPAFRRRLPA